MQNDLMHI